MMGTGDVSSVQVRSDENGLGLMRSVQAFQASCAEVSSVQISSVQAFHLGRA